VNGIQVMTKRRPITNCDSTTPRLMTVCFHRPKTKGDVWIEYQIHAPHDTNLVIHHVLVRARDRHRGDIDANGSRGDIVLMLRILEHIQSTQNETWHHCHGFHCDTHRSFISWAELRQWKYAGSHRIRSYGYGGITVKSLRKKPTPSAENSTKRNGTLHTSMRVAVDKNESQIPTITVASKLRRASLELGRASLQVRKRRFRCQPRNETETGLTPMRRPQRQRGRRDFRRGRRSSSKVPADRAGRGCKLGARARAGLR